MQERINQLAVSVFNSMANTGLPSGVACIAALQGVIGYIQAALENEGRQNPPQKEEFTEESVEPFVEDTDTPEDTRDSGGFEAEEVQDVLFV